MMSGIPKSSILVGLSGRTGNQMFQYAAGRAAALRQDLDLLLDIRHFELVPKLSYALDNFPIAARIAAADELPPLKGSGLAYRFRKAQSTLTGRRIVEARNSFTARALTPPGGAELKGYWQNERYFRDFAETIRAELTPAISPSAREQSLAAEIRACATSVSVHVRRTDYIELAQAFVLLPGTFFAEAGQSMATLLGTEPTFFVFSDDPEWVVENIELPGKARFVGHDGNTTAEGDMLLMSLCDHHIIANSTFSWWGAWLNPKPRKIVIGPKTWYVGDWLSSDFILPPDWIAHPVPGIDQEG